MPRFLVAEPPEAVLRALGRALDVVDFAIILLDSGMRVRFANDRVSELFMLPAEFILGGADFRALLQQVAASGGYLIPEADLPAYLKKREDAVRAGCIHSRVIELAHGRTVEFRCQPCPDGGRILTYTDMSGSDQDTTALQSNADMRFNVEMMESQAAHLAALAEAAEDNVQRAEAAKLLLQNEIAERRQLEIELRRMATTDGLTGAMNRSELMTIGQRETEQARRSGNDLVVLMLDVDHFKAINDRYGHAGGDAALQFLVTLLRAGIRNVDILGRLGGEEFAIILPATAPGPAQRVAQRLITAVSNTSIAFGDAHIAITVSIGLAARRHTDRTIEQIIARADNALYRAKGNGRNRVVIEVEPTGSV